MRHTDATALLQHTIFESDHPQTWADLGCGTGTFTLALADLLPEQSTIYAVDKSASALRQIPDQFHGVFIQTAQLNFTKATLPIENLNGILMANALHYIRDKRSFLEKMNAHLQPNGCWLIIEYETSRANPWVPYPMRFADLRALFAAVGFATIDKLGEHPSRYHGAMYAALASR